MHRHAEDAEGLVVVLIVLLLFIWFLVFRPTVKRGLLHRLYDQRRPDG